MAYLSWKDMCHRIEPMEGINWQTLIEGVIKLALCDHGVPDIRVYQRVIQQQSESTGALWTPLTHCANERVAHSIMECARMVIERVVPDPRAVATATTTPARGAACAMCDGREGRSSELRDVMVIRCFARDSLEDLTSVAYPMCMLHAILARAYWFVLHFPILLYRGLRCIHGAILPRASVEWIIGVQTAPSPHQPRQSEEGDGRDKSTHPRFVRSRIAIHLRACIRDLDRSLRWLLLMREMG